MKPKMYQIDLLGTSFTIASNEESTYLDSVLKLLKERIEETQTKVGIDDPLKLSILTSLFLVDEIKRGEERSEEGGGPPSIQIDRVQNGQLDRLISAIDGVLNKS